MALFLAVAPATAVLQFRAIAPLALAAMAGAVLLAWRRPTLPAPAWLALALMVWGAGSSLWAVDPGRSLFEGARMAGLVLLAGIAAGALATGRIVLTRWLLGGLLAGAALAFADQVSGHAIRAAVRGLAEWNVALGFGLKPAATVLAVLLPLALTLPVSRALRGAVLLAVLAAIFAMPAQAAKIGVLAGLAGFALTRLAGPRAARAIAVAAALLLLLTPALLGAVLARGPDISAMQGSAAHRVLIWDFTLARIAERPWLGWGMESSRAIPGGRAMIPTADLDRFGLAGQHEWFETVRAQRLPLHTHNASLQLWLELGGIGAALGAALVLALGWRATSPGAAGAFAAAVVVGSLSYGIWQGWWLCLLALLALTSRQLSSAPPPR
jgi:O-antigen ligase